MKEGTDAASSTWTCTTTLRLNRARRRHDGEAVPAEQNCRGGFTPVLGQESDFRGERQYALEKKDWAGGR